MKLTDIQKLFDFLLAEKKDLNEDFNSIVVERLYRTGDLVSYGQIYDNCIMMGIDCEVTLNIVHNWTKVTLLRNYIFSSEGIRLMLDTVPASQHDSLQRQLAAAKSVEGNIAALNRQLTDVLSPLADSFQVRFYLRKSSICQVFSNFFPNINSKYLFWVSEVHLWKSISENPKRFLDLIWKDIFPILVILDLSEKVQFHFCIITKTPHLLCHGENDQEAFEVARHIALKLLTYQVALKFLMCLTLSPCDATTLHYLRRFLKQPESSISTEKLPFSESQYYDFKERVHNMATDVAAFANACGGLLVYGLDKTGKIIGVDPTKASDAISNDLVHVHPTPRHEIVDVEVGKDQLIVVILIYPPRLNQHYTLDQGQRPFRFGSQVSYFPENEEILKKRSEICRTCQ